MRRPSAASAAALLLAASLSAAGPARAVTYAVHELVCPLDGQPFTQGLPTPGTPLGAMLDLKPWGPVIAPAVLPACPGSGFLVFRPDLDAAAVARYRALVATPRWTALRDDPAHTDYWRLARLREWAGDDPVEIAFDALYATWEVDRDPAQYARYAASALVDVDRALAAAPADPRAPTLRLVGVELARRLGRFDAAAARLEALESTHPDDPTLRRVLAQQRALVDARDDRSHRLEDARAP